MIKTFKLRGMSDIRKERGIKLGEIAELTGISIEKLFYLEKCKEYATGREADLIAGALICSKYKLYHGETSV